MKKLIPLIILAVVAGLVALRRSSRFRGGQQARAGGPGRVGPARADGWRAALGRLAGYTGLVAAREIQQRIRGRIFRVGTLLILAVVAAAIVIPVLNKSKSGPQQTGVVGGLSGPLRAAVVAAGRSIGTTVRLIPEASVAAARADLHSGRVDLAIVDAREILVSKAIGTADTSTTAQLVRAVARTLGVEEAFAAVGLSAAQAAQLAGARPLPVTSLEPAPARGAAHTTSLIGLILVFLMLTQYNTWTLIGVMEEKSSRVVEVLLAAVRPVQLLGGKVLGIGVVAFAQAALIVAFALVLARAVGSDLLHGTAPLALVSTLAWLVLGYAFYCWVYAAAGSMAERQDQVQSLAFPLSLPIVFGYIIALTTASSGSPSAFFKVLAYLPPTAPFAMPVLVGLGAVSWWEFAASAALSLLCTVGVARIATSIYRRAILRTGRRVRLREVVPGMTR
jgi:ABC-2 type transport system permease protein